MDYFKILKDSYEITLKHKYLWIFGIFAGGAAMSFGWNTNFYGTNSLSNDWPNNANSFNFEQFWTNYWSVIVAILGLLFLLGLLWMIFSVISQGALLGSIRHIKENKENNFHLGFAFGWHKFWRVFAVGLIIGLLFFFSAALFVVPIILFVLIKAYVLAVIYGLLTFFLALVFWLYLGLLAPYILRIAILGDKGSWEAVNLAWPFFQKHWKDILIIYLLMMAVGIVIGIGIILTLLLVGGLFFLIGLAIYLASSIAAWIFAGFAILVLLVLFAVLAGAINTFNYSVFTLAYLEMAKKF